MTDATAAGAPRPICFMIMPYNTKPTGLEAAKGPVQVDFDALWDKALRPLLEEDLGFEAVRADQDLGPLIIQEMIERLALADVVVADVSVANANVYYEIGVRHAAHRAGCVLIAADWARPVFDLDQMRQLRYPLPEAVTTDAMGQAIRAKLRDGIRRMASGPSAVFELLPGFPSAMDVSRAGAFRKRVTEISTIMRDVAAARHAAPSARKAKAIVVAQQHRQAAINVPVVALELLTLLRDAAAWAEIGVLARDLPETTRQLGLVQELTCLALAKTGDDATAIGALEELIERAGDSSERRGLLGGRHKRLSRSAATEADRRHHLDCAVDEYTRGMLLDLNDYYPTSNLPRLLRQRGNRARRKLRSDEERAQEAATITVVACRRALARNPADQWLRPTLLGAAFDAGDVDTAQELLQEMQEASVPPFHNETTLADLDAVLATRADDETTAALREIIDELRAMLPAPSPVT